MTRNRITDTAPELAPLLDSWRIDLEAAHKSPATVRTYLASARQYLAWCASTGRPGTLDRRGAAGFTASLLAGGSEPATANVRHRALRRLGAWLAAEGEADRNPLEGMPPPKLDSKRVPKLTDDELRALIAACAGKRLCDRRDEAIVRLASEALCRAEELLSLTVDDVDLRRGIAVIRRGKGGKARIVPFGPQTARAIDRYLRLRRSHPRAAGPALWLGHAGKAFGYSGLYVALKRRAGRAGITGFHPHRLRHTGASRWLAAGGSEGGLMAVAGWSSRDMITRYTEDTAMERAAEESRRLALGDL